MKKIEKIIRAANCAASDKWTELYISGKDQGMDQSDAAHRADDAAHRVRLHYLKDYLTVKESQ